MVYVVQALIKDFCGTLATRAKSTIVTKSLGLADATPYTNWSEKQRERAKMGVPDGIDPGRVWGGDQIVPEAAKKV